MSLRRQPVEEHNPDWKSATQAEGCSKALEDLGGVQLHMGGVKCFTEAAHLTVDKPDIPGQELNPIVPAP